MEHLPTSPSPHLATIEAQAAPAADPRAACCAAPAARASGTAGKLDLTGMATPGDLQATRLEEFTIDGICGVY